jgi:hypothetical protein
MSDVPLQHFILHSSEIVPDPSPNPNVMEEHEEEALRASIVKYGVVDPIKVRDVGDGVFMIADGHHRFNVAVAVGIHEIPCVLAPDLDDTEVGLFRLAMGVSGHVDLRVAADIVTRALDAGLEREDLVVTGLTKSEIDDLITISSPDDVFDDGAEVPHGPGPTVDDSHVEPSVHLLEFEFDDKSQLGKVKRRLRKLAGKGNDLKNGLLLALGLDE